MRLKNNKTIINIIPIVTDIYIYSPFLFSIHSHINPAIIPTQIPVKTPNFGEDNNVPIIKKIITAIDKVILNFILRRSELKIENTIKYSKKNTKVAKKRS